MDAFLEFERELARKRQAEKPLQPPKTFRSEPPIKPNDDECCNLNCPNCVLLVYQEQLMEYEDSVRWSSRQTASTDKLTPQPVEISLTLMDSKETLKPNEFTSNVPLGVSCLTVESNETYGSSNFRQVKVKLPQGYSTGDNLVVHMFNEKALVRRCVERLGLDQNAVLRVNSSSNVPASFCNQWITLDVLLTWALDLTSALRPRHLRLMASYATDIVEQQKILAMAEDWTKDCDGMNIVELLEAHPTISLSVDHFLAIAPPLLPRQYSISSSAECSYESKSAFLAVSTRAQGRCAMYLAKENSFIHGYTTPSLFSSKLPLDLTPKLFIGAGTGIAPFRAFINMLSSQKLKSPTSSLPRVALFQGCRDSGNEWLYKDFFHNAHKIQQSTGSSVIEHWFPAFSRDPNKPKKYVQDALLDHYGIVGDYIVKHSGSVFICGSIAMGRDVKHALVSCIEKSQKWSHETAKEYIATMQKEKRLISEIW